MEHINSIRLYNRGKKIIPGSVNSPVRSFDSVGSKPLFIDRGRGSRLFDVDGNEFIDYISSWGPLILGHGNEDVKKAIEKQLDKGSSFGLSTKLEIEMAELLTSSIDGLDMVRLVNSGTEAVISALRLARGYTSRRFIVKFDGCYHGHGDSMLVSAGSGVISNGSSSSLGVSKGMIADTLVCNFNDFNGIDEVFRNFGDDIAAVIVEPIPCNMGVVKPKKGFIRYLRDVTSKFGSLLIFDEVITGFRVRFGSVGSLFNVVPDLFTFGKIIGGGLPVGAYGGRGDIMSLVSPIGGVYQAGTLSGNPLALSAGITLLKILRDDASIYSRLNSLVDIIEGGLNSILKKNSYPITTSRFGSLFSLFFKEGRVESLNDVKSCDLELFSKFHKGMMERGILLPPSQYEAWFFSYSHSKDDINLTLKACEEAFSRVFNCVI